MKLRTTKYYYMVFFVLAVLSCTAYFGYQYKEHYMTNLNPKKLKAFNLYENQPKCARWRDNMPRERNAAAYAQYKKARDLWRSKMQYEFHREELQNILDDVDGAAQKGDWGARALMAHFYLYGLGTLDTNHVLDSQPEKSIVILRAGVDAGQPWAYYDLGVAYEHGYGGVPQNSNIAWAYYLKAAELGSPNAQLSLASAYAKIKRWDAEQAMVQCAYSQGHPAAALALGMDAKVARNYFEAMTYYQQGVKFGSKDCASAMMLFFDASWRLSQKKEMQQRLQELNIVPDMERSRRYSEIADALTINPDLRFASLDKIVPLPPLELPIWRGIDDAIEPEDILHPSY